MILKILIYILNSYIFIFEYMLFSSCFYLASSMLKGPCIYRFV